MAMLHARPGGRRTRLAVRPALASWERPSHPDQVKFNRYLEHVTELAQPALDQDGPLALEFFVGAHVRGPEGIVVSLTERID